MAQFVPSRSATAIGSRGYGDGGSCSGKAASSIRELAPQLDLSPDTLERTVAAFNAAVGPGTFNHAVLDDCRTAGLTPEKTHWARRIDTPPFWGYPLRPGITFTYLGVKV